MTQHILDTIRLALVCLFAFSWYRAKTAPTLASELESYKDQVLYLCLIILIDMVAKWAAPF